MSLFDSISSKITSLNDSVRSQVSTCLGTQLTQGELDQVMGIITDVFSQGDIDALKSLIDEEDLAITNKLQTLGDASVTSGKEENKEIKNSSVQDNTRAFQIPEVPVISKKYAEVSKFPPASNALSEDYPDTFGSIDEAHNWFKVNKKTGYTEFVHNSGSSLKIDKAGNTSIHITGNLKFIIDNDLILNVLKHLDIHSLGNTSLHSSNMDINVGSLITSMTPLWKHKGDFEIR